MNDGGRGAGGGGSWHAESVVVARAPDRKGIDELALVLRARGLQHAILPDHSAGGRSFVLLVPAHLLHRAGHELDDYVKENSEPPAPPPAPRPRPSLWPGALAYVAVLAFVWQGQTGGALPKQLLPLGRVDSEAIRAGEWWRCVTALTLHLDVPHIVGNLVIGLSFGLFLSYLLGSGVAWLGILLAGALGNAANVLLRQPEHLSAGASTAVFGALGLITTASLLLRGHLRVGRWRRWAPLAAGVALLGYLGMGEGERTDVAAHIFGFLAGLLVGWPLAARARERPEGPGVQLLAGLVALGLVTLSWWRAWTAAG